MSEGSIGLITLFGGKFFHSYSARDDVCPCVYCERRTIMSIFTKKLADWTLVDCIKMTIGTIAVGYTAEKIYETYQERQKVSDTYDGDFNDNDVYVQEEETSE